MSSVRVVIREARPKDAAARESLLRLGIASHHTEAFLYFFFQELTLQCVVLGGAVMFIFVGAPVWVCSLLLPAAALLVAFAVHIAHGVIGDNQVQKMRNESMGWVAEALGPLGALPPKPPRPLLIVHQQHRHWAAEGGAGGGGEDGPQHPQIVGTASLSELWGPVDGGWLHGVAVAGAWRRRGVARALVAAAAAQAQREGRAALEAAAGALGGGRALLHAAGWALRHSYHRPLLGAALTLPLLRLARDLPHA